MVKALRAFGSDLAHKGKKESFKAKCRKIVYQFDIKSLKHET